MLHMYNEWKKKKNEMEAKQNRSLKEKKTAKPTNCSRTHMLRRRLYAAQNVFIPETVHNYIDATISNRIKRVEYRWPAAEWKKNNVSVLGGDEWTLLCWQQSGTELIGLTSECRLGLWLFCIHINLDGTF